MKRTLLGLGGALVLAAATSAVPHATDRAPLGAEDRDRGGDRRDDDDRDG